MRTPTQNPDSYGVADLESRVASDKTCILTTSQVKLEKVETLGATGTDVEATLTAVRRQWRAPIVLRSGRDGGPGQDALSAACA
jgi:hypothetical protein